MELIHRFAQTQVDTSPLPNVQAATTRSEIQLVLTIVFTITGAIALLIITIAGFRYVLSRGDPQAVAQAKDTIIYAGVGLVVSLVAFSIVTFVLKSI
jgi:uncharacterized protein YacL